MLASKNCQDIRAPPDSFSKSSDIHSSDIPDFDTLDISLNKCDPDPDDLPIALRKGKRSCAKYPISQFVSSKHLTAPVFHFRH